MVSKKNEEDEEEIGFVEVSFVMVCLKYTKLEVTLPKLGQKLLQILHYLRIVISLVYSYLATISGVSLLHSISLFLFSL